MAHRRITTLYLAFVALGIALVALPLTAADLPMVGKPEEVGFSSEGLARIDQAVQRHIDAGAFSGAVTLVVRHGRIAHFEAHGQTDLASKKPMAKDSIFRLASMSKPITAVAVMMMIEEGKIRLEDPVSRFIPEFKTMRVAVPKPGSSPAPAAAPSTGGGRTGGAAGPPPETDLVPAAREITVRDLLTHVSGLATGGLGVGLAGSLLTRGQEDTLATYIPKLGGVPLDFQPGALWRYSGRAGFDVLGRIVEIASGQPYDRFLRQRLFDPLGMKDTGFTITPLLAPRMVTMYQRLPNGGGLERLSDQGGLSSSVYFSGAGGLISTAEDYAQFATMLVNGGELNGRRYLRTQTIQMMSSNHTGDLISGQMGRPARGMGFGLGVQVVEDPNAAGLRQSKGAWGWSGAYGTNANIEPAEDMVTIIMIQRGGAPDDRQRAANALQRDFEDAVAQAIVK